MGKSDDGPSPWRPSAKRAPALKAALSVFRSRPFIMSSFDRGQGEQHFGVIFEAIQLSAVDIFGRLSRSGGAVVPLAD